MAIAESGGGWYNVDNDAACSAHASGRSTTLWTGLSQGCSCRTQLVSEQLSVCIQQSAPRFDGKGLGSSVHRVLMKRRIMQRLNGRGVLWRGLILRYGGFLPRAMQQSGLTKALHFLKRNQANRHLFASGAGFRCIILHFDLPFIKVAHNILQLVKSVPLQVLRRRHHGAVDSIWRILSFRMSQSHRSRGHMANCPRMAAAASGACRCRTAA
jgi:hypothetical protein